MDSGFKISVVIPTFNRQATLSRAIESVLAQSYPAMEIIVVDDGSTDGTRELVGSTSANNIQYIFQQNQGVSGARNRGIEQSKGDWIALLDSDDEWLPDKLEAQVKAIRTQPEYSFCHTNEIWVRNGRRVNQMIKHEKNGGYIFEKCLPLCVISPSSVLIKKSVFEATGLFDESLPACEDYDLWLRHCAKYPVLYIDQPLLVKYGGHADQLSGKHVAMDQFRLQSLVKLLKTGDLTQEQISVVKNTFNKKYNILYRGALKHGNKQLVKLCESLYQEVHCRPTETQRVS